MRTKRMAIGDTYYDGGQYCWEGSCTNDIDAAADLIVEGNVAIGTIDPGLRMLTVAGDIEITGNYYGKGSVPSGAVMAFDLADCPDGWIPADGTMLTPNLIDRTIVGSGDSYSLRDSGGAPTHKLEVSEMPKHTHLIGKDSWLDTSVYSASGFTGDYAKHSNKRYTEPKGGGLAHNNMQPYIALLYCKKK